jgi:glycosyltransferase involved in cell wall biosynthesis
VGTCSRDYFLHYGADPQRVFVVPHVVDSDWISAEASRWHKMRGDLRRKWRFPEGDAVFLFAGKFTEIKRPLDFVLAISQARRAGAPVRGLMVGDGVLRLDCERKAINMDSPIQFTGFLNQREILQAYIDADALVLPSESETWGMVVNEAMICGRPCFVSGRVGCASDLIAESVTGATFPCGDTDRLAALLEHYADRRVLSGMGSQARQKIDSYSPGMAADRLVGAVQSALMSRSRGPQEARTTWANLFQ